MLLQFSVFPILQADCVQFLLLSNPFCTHHQSGLFHYICDQSNSVIKILKASSLPWKKNHNFSRGYKVLPNWFSSSLASGLFLLIH